MASAARAPVRRQAESNYLDVNRELALHRLESFHAAARGPFELLQSKFGFQRASVANQKENLGCWITNYQMRVRAEAPQGAAESIDFVTRTALARVHKKFFKNYLTWCKFLRTPPRACDPDKDNTTRMEKELALFLLLWGEAGNLRFMPECICFLYHNMAAKIEFLDTLPDVGEMFYLNEIVRPVYGVIAKMRTATAPPGERPFDHQDTTNYDDVNEFFWTSKCLECDEMNVAQVLEVHDPKTFKEKRSMFNPVLAFFRVWYFLVVVFHVLVVITYVAYMAEGDDSGGLGFFFRIFDSGQNKIRAHAFYSIFVTVTGLLAMKVVMQIWLFGLRLYKDMWMAVGVFCRLIWHSMFFALFMIINFSPDQSALFGSLSSVLPGGGTAGSYLSMGLVYLAIYSIPVLTAATMRAFFPNAIWGIRVVNALDGTSRQYVGRNTAQPWANYSQYSLSWYIIFFCKFLFALQFMIRPLMAPSIEIYDITVDDNGVFQSGHNVMFILALWAPIFVVYMYDTQIWFILYQSLIGLIMGKRMHIGHYVGLAQLKKGMAGAPKLFDEKVVSLRTRKPNPDIATPVPGGGDIGELRHRDVVRVRFAIIWNQVVDNFRLNDLLDDRETVILQYRILNKGERIQEPIFLLAGKLSKAVEVAAKARSSKWDTATLVKNIATADALEGMKNGLELVRDIFYLLLGEEEEKGALSVLEYIYSSPDVVSLLDLTFMPQLSNNVVELLAAVLDMPEDISTIDSLDNLPEELRMELHVQVAQVVDRLRTIALTLELMLNDDTVSRKLHTCRFLQATEDLEFQTQRMIDLYKADAVAETGLIAVNPREERATPPPRFAPEDFISSCTRLFFLLRLDVASSLPRCEDAKRRMGFFLHSLAMEMPRVDSLEAMPSFSVMTPYYSETVLFTLDELNNPVHSNALFAELEKKQKAKGWTELTIMKYLITFHAEEWSNFLERMGARSLDDALEINPTEVRLWASMRGQTLARTVHGMMLYEDAIRLLRWLEVYSLGDMSLQEKLDEMNRISALKFSYITGCQIYSQQVAKGDHRADDIDYLMKKFPSWRVSFVDAIKEQDGDKEVSRFDCVLVKAEGNEIVEVYRYELPGNPILGEGKPENQNVALPFTRGEYLQTIDMNQEHYLEECLKMPNFLATATSTGEEVTVIGMKEHVFTGRASSLARFMTLQELVFVTLTQRVLAKPLRSRMHYGHPDVFEKSFVVTSGGVSKASKGINLSEDVFSGYNVTLRGGLVTHVEFMQCGKGRDVTLSQINAFEAKLSNGCAESCLSREGHRLTNSLDFSRLNSMFYGHFGFYICNALTVFCVYVYAYCKLYVATHSEVETTAIMKSGSLDSLASVMTTQYLLQFGMLTTLPLFATLFVEFGFKQALMKVVELISTLGIVFYVFLTGTKAHFYDVALIRGGSKYRGTGRGFSITRDPMVNFFKEYGVSHFRKAVELIGVMILFGIYGSFDIGSTALEEYCATADFDCDKDPDLIPANVTSLAAFSSKSQSYGIASFAVLFLGACWLMAPFVFNTDGLVLQKSKLDIANWFTWMMRSQHKDDEENNNDKSASSAALQPKDGWDDWWKSDVDLMVPLGLMGRLTYCIRELRHPLAMYYVFLTEFTLPWLALLFGAMGATWALLWFGNRVHHCVSKHRKLKSLAVQGILYMVGVIGGILLVPLIIGSIGGWSVLKCLTFSISMILGFNSIVQYAMAFNGAFGMEVAMWSPMMTLGFLMDMMVGLFLVVPLFLLSLLPFMRILQTRAMYNGGFSRALSSGSEVAASLCILLGLLGGFIHGFTTSFVYTLGYINDASDNFMNRSFYYFVTTKLPNSGSEMLSYMENGYLKITCAGVSIVAVLLSLLIGRVLGRRVNMAIGGSLIFVSLFLNFISSTSILLVSCGLAAMGSAMLVMNYLLYSYEICTKGWRGKSVTIFLLGSMTGWFVHSLLMANTNATTISQDWDNKPTNMWRLQPVFVQPALLVAFFAILWFVPESPVWLLAHSQEEPARAVLVRLRRRQNVNPEIAVIQAELALKTRQNHLLFRLSIVFALQAVFGLIMSQALLIRRTLQVNADDSGNANNYWEVYFALCCATGYAFGSFLVDNVRRKTILKEFLPFVALMAFTCGVIGSVSNADGGLVQALLCLLYISAGLSLMSVTWLSALEMFPASRRPLYWTLSLCVFYAVQAVVYVLDPSFALAHFILSGCSAALTAVLFMFCASTKLGAIQTKAEKKYQRSMRESAPEAAEAADEHGDDVDDLHKQQTRIAQASAAMNRSAASNPASSAAQVNFGASAAGGPPASSAGSRAQANATQFGFSGVNVVGQRLSDSTRRSSTHNETDHFSFHRLQSMEEPRPPMHYGISTGLSRGLSSSQSSSTDLSATNAERLRQMTRLSSTFDFEAEFEAEHIEDLRQGQIAYPRGQPRSVSFLQSQQYPDAELHAETQSVKL
ncbi:Callose synthase 7 [Phytophthora fragariae]|uniref:1,3-beta-glucan synthase n=1 Tax=Phytophthora fragariae TaxID=53985 RepID=A0A6A3FPY4_9STRA|nr:Callose synthase 7 [Phytophthora fragariae]KAE8948145.1 Callose synthase 7 [Phytophthora fragariae]KAE9120148.1 Callose synthase 7 [Phytophthora fragariae]KAE9144930.1 Callose synthase 7 [Phytophthora fragariae]KAE9232410.1 Callose synthase 7 [Phytophthora fragariae]